MKPILTAHIVHPASAVHSLNLEARSKSLPSLAYGQQMKFHKVHAVEKSHMCPHLELLAEQLTPYGRPTL
jgi:hypothetical protein